MARRKLQRKRERPPFIVVFVAAPVVAVLTLVIAARFPTVPIIPAISLGIPIVGGFRDLLKSVLVDRRSELRHVSRRVGATVSLTLAVRIGGRARRWQAEDWRANLSESPQQLYYSLDLLRAAVRMRLYDLGGLLIKVACWILASNFRTWGLLGPTLAYGLVDVTLEQGLGSAIYTVPSIVAISLGVEWLRHRWGVNRRPRSDSPDR